MDTTTFKRQKQLFLLRRIYQVCMIDRGVDIAMKRLRSFVPSTFQQIEKTMATLTLSRHQNVDIKVESEPSYGKITQEVV